MKKWFDSRSDIHIALLQIRSTPLGQGLPSPATLLFNCLVGGIMPIIDRSLINTDNDDEYHIALVNRQYRNEQGIDTSKNFVSLPIGSTVVVQWKDGGLWTHGSIQDKGNQNHHDRSYKICITKTGKIITHNRWHIKPTPISAEHYLHGQLSKHAKTDPLNTILGHLEKHPPPSTVADTTNERPHYHYTSNVWTAPDSVQRQMEEKATNITQKSKDNNDNNKEDVMRKPDRLTY